MSSLKCHRCNKICKTKGGLTNHLKSCINKIKNKPTPKNEDLKSCIIKIKNIQIPKDLDPCTSKIEDKNNTTLDDIKPCISNIENNQKIEDPLKVGTMLTLNQFITHT